MSRTDPRVNYVKNVQRTSSQFEVNSRGRIYLGRETLDALGLDNYAVRGRVIGVEINVKYEHVDVFDGMGIAGRFFEFETPLQRDGAFTIPKAIRDHAGLSEGDEVWLTVEVVRA